MAEVFDFSTIEKNELQKIELQKIYERRNDQKGRYSLAHFGENWKIVKIEVTGPNL